MNNYISNLIQQTCDDEVYSQSYHDFLESKLTKLSGKMTILSKIVNEEAVNADDLKQVFESNGTFYTSSAIKSAIDNGLDDILDIEGQNSIPLDQLLDDIKEKYIEADIVCSSIDSKMLDISADAAAKASLLMNRISNKYNDISGNAKQLVDELVSITGDGSATARDKVTSVYNLLNPGATLYNNYQDLETDTDNSLLENCTGVNPFKSIGLSIKESFESIDLSSVKNAIVTGCNAVKKAFIKGTNWLKDHAGSAVANIARTTTEALGVTNTDWKSLTGGDGTVDNAFVVIDGPVSDFQQYVLTHHTGDYRPLTSTAMEGTTTTWATFIANQLTTFQLNIWHRFDMPGAHVYFIIYGNDILPSFNHSWVGVDLRAKLVIKYRPVDLSCINAISQSDSSVLGEMISDVTNLSASFDPSLENNFYTLDSYMFSCCLLGKALHAYTVTNNLSNYALDKTYSEMGYANKAAVATAIALLGVTGQGINPTVSGHQVVIGGVTYDDPTNEDFALVLSSFKDDYSGTFDWNVCDGSFANSSINISNYLCGTIAMMFDIYGSQDSSDLFTPYIKTNSIAKGSYYIRSDSDNVNKVLIRTGAIAGAIVVTTATIAGLNYTKQLKLKAVTSNLQAGTIQSTIQEKLKNGIKPTRQELNECYKKTKKAVRLNKLTGGFASITTGLSTWGSDSLNLPGIGGSITDIQTLISG